MSPPYPAPVPPHRILVVDDNIDSARMMAILLQALGHPVESAHTAQSGIAAARRFLPDVVFLDLNLPDLHGSELAQQLRREPGLEGIRIYALTGSGSEEDHHLAIDAGCDAYLVKPVDPQFLTSLLGRRHF